ncbi:hypothetical protein Tco_1072875, partial [Tanacetum coccineum]
ESCCSCILSHFVDLMPKYLLATKSTNEEDPSREEANDLFLAFAASRPSGRCSRASSWPLQHHDPMVDDFFLAFAASRPSGLVDDR